MQDPILAVRLLCSTCYEFSNKIIIGDLNADILCDNKADSKWIRDLMNELSFKFVNMEPTHHTFSRGTWIDILLVNQYETIIDFSRVLTPILSRHDIISLNISITIKKFAPTI